MTVCYGGIPAVIQNINLPGEGSPKTPFPGATQFTLPAKTPARACPQPKHWRWTSPRRAAGTEEKKTQLGEGKKKSPSWGFFYSNMVWVFFGYFYISGKEGLSSPHTTRYGNTIINRTPLKPTHNPLRKHNHQPYTTQQHWQSTTTLIALHAHPIRSAACLPAGRHPMSAELLGYAVPRSLKIHCACKNPSSNLTAVQTLAINITSPSS